MKISILCSVLLFIACGPSRTATTQQRNVILEDELRNSTASNAYELIRLIRPDFFRPQGTKTVVPLPTMAGKPMSTRLPVIYSDEIRYGYPEDLVKLRPENVKEVQYLDEQDANLRFELGHSAGAILVITKK